MTALFIMCLALFGLNDLIFIALSGDPVIYTADYVFRVTVLAFCGLSAAGRRAVFHEGDPRFRPSGFIYVAVPIFALLPTGVYYMFGVGLEHLTGYEPLFHYPRPQPGALRWLDITFGLALVALSEELVFRRIAKQVLERLLGRGARITLISALLFAAIHWGGGLSAVLVAFVFGIAAMDLYRHDGRLWPVVAAHYFADLLVFA